jgi:hypothetical protein
MTTLMFSFLHKALGDANLGATLRARPAQDGGRRILANTLYRASTVGARVLAQVRAFTGVPRWVAPAASAVALAALVAVQRRRLH